MPKVVNVDKVQRALDRAARNAQRGSSEARAGRFTVVRNSDGRAAVGSKRLSVREAAKKTKK
jgi:hypothetical protein